MPKVDSRIQLMKLSINSYSKLTLFDIDPLNIHVISGILELVFIRGPDDIVSVNLINFVLTFKLHEDIINMGSCHKSTRMRYSFRIKFLA